MAVLEQLMVHLGVDATTAEREARRAADGIERAMGGLKGIGATLGKAFALGPALAPAVAAAGGLAAAFASAGAGAGAFFAAVKPQFADITSAADLYTKAMEAQAEGGEKAKQAMAEYKAALDQMPAATRATATEFIGLKNDFKSWSDSLAGDTMPVFTEGLKTVRGLLPTLTPFVQDAAKNFTDLGKRLSTGIKSDGFKSFMSDMRSSANETLPALLNSIVNVGKGVGGMIQAFLPMGGQMTGGIEKATAAFARFGTSLKDSAGFAKFKELATSGGGALGQLATAVGQLLVSLQPVLGVTTQLAIVMANLVAAIPVDVLTTFGQILLVVKAGMMAWTLYSQLAAAATGLWSSAVAIFNAVMAMNPIVLIVLAIIALIAVIVIIATKTTWFQTIWATVWGAIKTASIAVWNWLKSALKATFDFLKNIFLNFTGPGLIIKHWDRIKSATSAAWSWVKQKISSVISGIKSVISGMVSIVSTVVGYFGRIKSGVATKVGALISFVKGIPGKVKSAVGSLGSILVNAGKSIIKGLISGISSMIGSLKSKLGSITSMIPDWKGPMTVDMKLLTPSGEAILDGFMKGIDRKEPALRKQLGKLTTGIPSMLGTQVSSTITTKMQPADSPVRFVFDVTGADEDMKRFVRKIVRVDGGGSAQLGLGRRAAA